MARYADTPCAGGCGKLLFRGRGSLPPGQAMCRECRRGGKGVADRLPRACPVCGIRFRPARLPRGGVSRTCSRSCGQKLRYAESGRYCEICGERYRASFTKQRTCSRACGIELRRREGTIGNGGSERRRWPTCRVWFADCEGCGSVFASPRRRRFCSQVCADQTYARGRRITPLIKHCSCGAGPLDSGRRKCDSCVEEARRQAKRRRRARERGARTESYTLAEIALRDKRMCGLCGKRVAMTKAVPHPKAPTIDHVIPLVEGGGDVRANVQLAHFLCNSLKSAGGSQQLALIG